MHTPDLHVAAFQELDVTALHAIIRLRIDVFVVEQACPYPELDGRDIEPDARHLWLEQDGAVVGYLRVLQDPDDVVRIGRVVVAPAARGSGAAGRLMEAAIDLVGVHTSVLDAQSHLTGFYESHGFVADGPEFLEDGIPHVRMIRRPCGGADAGAAGTMGS